jgi:hypothetical protein
MNRKEHDATGARTVAEIARFLASAAKGGWKLADFALFRQPWLDADPPKWDFPIWRPIMRPFDWAIDEADVPIPPAPPPWSLPERQRFNLYLRPAGAS